MALELRRENIPVDRIDVAEENVRVEEEYEKDLELERNIRKQGVLQDIVGRWEGDRFKVILGRRRFHALKDLGVKEISVKVADLEGYEAISASLSENVMRQEINPVLRARAAQRLIELNPDGLAGVSRDLGIPKPTLSSWTRVLDLEPVLLGQLREGNLRFKDALRIARSGASAGEQELVAEIAGRDGKEAVKRVMRQAGVEKRGAPRGLLTLRFNFDPEDEHEKRYYQFVRSEATRLGVDPGKLIKGITVDWVKKRLREGSAKS